MDHEYFQRTFGLDAGVLSRVMAAALSRGGDFCDLYFQQRTLSTLSLEDNEVNRAYHNAGLGVGIRVVQGDATGYGYSEDLAEQAMTGAALAAGAIAGAGGATAPQDLTPRRGEGSLYPIERRWDQVPVSERLPILTRVNERVFAADPRVVKVRMQLMDADTRVLIVRSDGVMVADEQPMTVLQVSCVAEQDGRREQNGHSVSGRRGVDLYAPQMLDSIADEVVARTLKLFEAVPPPAGELPVVLAPGSSGILLHEAIGHGMEADFNRKGTSIYADRVGKRIAPPFVSIVDDATLPGMRGAVNVDDEGNPGRRTTLVHDGVLQGYLHDRISARHYGVEPTGNGRRQSFRHMPLPRMRCTYMLPGPHEPAEIVRSVGRGIYAETFANGQVQIGAGDFTFYIKTGYLIEDGKLTAPIKDVNIIGNGPKVLERVEMVGNDLAQDTGGWTCGKDGQMVPVSIGLPTVKVGAVTVGGTGA